MSLPKGILAACVTAMNEDESINFENNAKLYERVIRGGVHGLFCLGTTGEFYAMTAEEKVAVVENAVKVAAGRVPVYAGVGAVSTGEVISLIKKMDHLDIAGYSVVSPFFITPSQDEIVAHYTKIAASTDKPILLYNIPGRTNLNIDPETVGKLCGIENIVGIKDSSGNFDNLTAYLKYKSDNFAVMAGSDGFIHDILKLGGTGAIAATSNIATKMVAGIYNEFVKGNLEKSKELQDRLAPLRNILNSGTVPGVLKACVNVMGVNVGPSRMPIEKTKPELYAKLQETMKEYYSDEFEN